MVHPPCFPPSLMYLSLIVAYQRRPTLATDMGVLYIFPMVVLQRVDNHLECVEVCKQQAAAEHTTQTLVGDVGGKCEVRLLQQIRTAFFIICQICEPFVAHGSELDVVLQVRMFQVHTWYWQFFCWSVLLSCSTDFHFFGIAAPCLACDCGWRASTALPGAGGGVGLGGWVAEAWPRPKLPPPPHGGAAGPGCDTPQPPPPPPGFER